MYICIDCKIEVPINETEICLSTKTYKKTETKIKYNINYAYSDKTLPCEKNMTCEKCNMSNMLYIRHEDMTVTYICQNIECKNIRD